MPSSSPITEREALEATAADVDKLYGCELISSDYGTYLLGPESVDEVVTWLRVYDGRDVNAVQIKRIGWMHNIGWDRDHYQLKREFVEETGYGSWWEGCKAPADEKPTAKCKRAWEIVR